MDAKKGKMKVMTMENDNYFDEVEMIVIVNNEGKNMEV